MIDPRALAALEAARDAIAEPEPAPTPEDAKAREDAARLAEQARLRRPTPEESGREWKRRRKALKRRTTLRLETLEQAEALYAAGIERPDPTVPKDARATSGVDRRRWVRAGKTARQHALEWLKTAVRDAGWAAVFAALPVEFADDPAPLCGVERELLSEPHEYAPPPAEDEGAEPRAEGYLMPGMRREGG